MVDDLAMGTMSDERRLIIVTRGAAPGEYVATRGERIERVYAVVAGETTWVFHDGSVYEIASGNGTGTRLRGTQHHGSLMAPMPATVVTINVQPGDEVKRGQALIDNLRIAEAREIIPTHSAPIASIGPSESSMTSPSTATSARSSGTPTSLASLTC